MQLLLSINTQYCFDVLKQLAALPMKEVATSWLHEDLQATSIGSAALNKVKHRGTLILVVLK